MARLAKVTSAEVEEQSQVVADIFGLPNAKDILFDWVIEGHGTQYAELRVTLRRRLSQPQLARILRTIPNHD